MYFRQLVFAAAAAGLLAGLILSLLQINFVTPIILDAEQYEVAETSVHDHSDPAMHTPEHMAEHLAALKAEQQAAAGHEHHHDPEAWAPKDGAERNFFTWLSSSVASIGFALLILAGMSYTQSQSIAKGALWGLAGFIVFFAAPGLGLHPEIPGMNAASLEGRQSWWLLTVSCTAIGLALAFFGKPAIKLGSVLFLAIPFIIGVPQPEAHGFANTAEDAVKALTQLESQFVQTTAWVNAVFWLMLGILCSLAINFWFKLPEDHQQ